MNKYLGFVVGAISWIAWQTIQHMPLSWQVKLFEWADKEK